MKRSAILVTFCFTALAAAGQSIKTKMEKGVDMTSYETFTVLKGELMTPPDARVVSDKELFQSVKAAVTREMELRGYKFVPDSSAQLYVSYVAGDVDGNGTADFLINLGTVTVDGSDILL